MDETSANFPDFDILLIGSFFFFFSKLYSHKSTVSLFYHRDMKWQRALTRILKLIFLPLICRVIIKRKTIRGQEGIFKPNHLHMPGVWPTYGTRQRGRTAAPRHLQSQQQTGNRLLCILIMRRSGQGFFAGLVLYAIKHAPDA